MTYIQSNIGGRSENQDYYGSVQTKFGELIVVCDGMGGYNGGRYAAEKAVQIITEDVIKSNETNPAKALQGAILKANYTIWQESDITPGLKGMGTTVVVLLITPEKDGLIGATVTNVHALPVTPRPPPPPPDDPACGYRPALGRFAVAE